ncbi:hypothetical protein A2V68_02085 [candidate division Kazan bacterium RBG_13_50_9]|uniref:Uncharacterized protein n=1 Tax=candidate division Kazan bacterium RBG_13_50_9 TaxID=1798535 RepID=A0A1F4NRP4_UNCK3|nr:MAG: hypothetical protein A2V68_02085 [candidate division Kazan bacterium RBG_13_50_9]
MKVLQFVLWLATSIIIVGGIIALYYYLFAPPLAPVGEGTLPLWNTHTSIELNISFAYPPKGVWTTYSSSPFLDTTVKPVTHKEEVRDDPEGTPARAVTIYIGDKPVINIMRHPKNPTETPQAAIERLFPYIGSRLMLIDTQPDSFDSRSFIGIWYVQILDILAKPPSTNLLPDFPRLVKALPHNLTRN